MMRLSRGLFFAMLAGLACVADADRSRADAADVPSRPVSGELSIDTSYVGNGTVTFAGHEQGESSAVGGTVRAEVQKIVDNRLTIPLDVTLQHLSLDRIGDAPVPDEIRIFKMSAGLRYRAADRWVVTGTLTPTLYRTDRVHSNDVGISGGVTALWLYSQSLRWMFGLYVLPDSEDFKLLPLAGFDWNITSQWHLRMMYPAPRLTWAVDDRLSVFAGSHLTLATFRTANSYGTDIGHPAYNNALASYRDIRLGCGVGYRFSDRVSGELEAGYSVDRQLSYTRMDEKVTFDPAPCGRLSLRMQF